MLLTEKEINDEQAVVIAHAMVKVASCDGVDEREKALITDFLTAVDTKENFASLAAKDFDVAGAKAVLGADERIMLLEGCWMVVLADRKISDAEKALVAKLANDLEVKDADKIRDYMVDAFMDSLSHVKNIDALAEIDKYLRS